MINRDEQGWIVLSFALLFLVALLACYLMWLLGR